MFSKPLSNTPSFSSRAVRSPPRILIACSVEKRSCPAGTGVCVVNTHLLRTCRMSASVGEFNGPPPISLSSSASVSRAAWPFVHVVHIYTLNPRAFAMRAPPSPSTISCCKAVIRVAAVQVIRQSAIPARVAIEICVEQVNRNDVPVAALQVIAPCTHRHIAAFH